MAVHYRTKGFVLAKKDLREADQLFSIYTQDFGKINILGRSIRKINSKLRAGINLFYLSEIEFIQGKNYKTLTDAIALQKLGYSENAFKISETLNSLVKEPEKDEKIWNLLTENLLGIENCKLENFNKDLLAIMGYGCYYQTNHA